MSDWWTYRLSDFLLFSPRTYYRMIERFNEAFWPAPVFTLTLGCMMLVLVLRQRAGQSRVLWSTPALLWVWIAWAFLWRRYSTINWAVVYFAPLFAIQGLLLAWAGWVRRPIGFPACKGLARVTGFVLLSGSILLYPAIVTVAGRPWQQAEVFGMTPDPTAIGTVGLTLLAGPRVPAWLLVIPVLWCLFSGLTLWAMASPEKWLPSLAAVVGVGSLTLQRHNRHRLNLRNVPAEERE